MVAVLVKLRFRVLWNTLIRSPWQMVGAAIGALYGLGLVGLLLVGFVGLSLLDPEIAHTALILGGCALLLGWVVGPLLIAGVDQTLDPTKLATFPIPGRTLFSAVTASALLGIPGILTAFSALASVIVWWRHPLAIPASLIGSAIAVATCVVGSRAVTALSAGAGSKRRVRELLSILIFIPIVLAGPIIIGVSNGLSNLADSLPTIATTLSWTPLGAAWALAGDAAVGAWLPLIGHLLIALATFAVLALLWRRSLHTLMANPIRESHSSGGSEGLGLFAHVPDTPTGAVMARTLTYWIRDPRYTRQLLVVPLVVVLFGVMSIVNGTGSFFAMAVIFAAILQSIAIYADIAMDGTAFALHLATGVRGVTDRAGRALSCAVISVPLIIVVTVVLAIITSEVAALPSMLGVALGLLLTGIGASSVASALIVFPVAKAGDNPFASQPGAGLPSGLSMLGTTGSAALLSLPTIVLGIVSAVTGDLMWGWVTLGTGLVLGAVFLTVGIRVGGNVYDRRAPELLATLRR